MTDCVGRLRDGRGDVRLIISPLNGAVCVVVGLGEKPGYDVRAVCRCADVRSYVWVEITAAWAWGSGSERKPRGEK